MTEPEDPTVEPDVIEGLARLVRVVEELRADREEDRALIDELLAELAQQGVRRPKAPPAYETWQQWVDEWLTARVSRHPHRHRWCRRYGDHPEVADRLEALWDQWEEAWPDVGRRLTWFRDALDHHLPVITAEDGPLRQCSAGEAVHALPAPLGQWGGRDAGTPYVDENRGGLNETSASS